MQAAEKESVILECEVDEEDAKVVWKKDGEVFKPADKKSDCNQLLKLFSLDILNALTRRFPPIIKLQSGFKRLKT